MAETDGRTKARLAVLAELAARRWNNTRLAREAGADIATISDFLSGARWPKSPTQGKVESALGWPPGTIAGVAAGLEPPSVGGPDDDAAESEQDSLLYRRPDGLTDEEWDRVRREAREYIEWQIEKASRER